MAVIDISDKITKLDSFEERVGVSLESLSVFLKDDNPDRISLEICGEIQTTVGTKLQQNISIVFDVYDTSGRIVWTDSMFCFANTFFGFLTFSESVHVPTTTISKIRIYPKKKW